MRYEYARAEAIAFIDLTAHDRWTNDYNETGVNVHESIARMSADGFRVNVTTTQTRVDDTHVLRLTEITGEREVTT